MGTENIDWLQMQDLVDRDLPLTFLAPYDRAWWRVRFATTEGEEIIRRHLFRGLYFCDVLANMTTVESVQGDVHNITLRGRDNEHLYVGEAFLFDCDILARNGDLHHVDRVLGMEYPTDAPTFSQEPTVTPVPTSLPPTADPAAQIPTVEFVDINYQSGYVAPPNPPNFSQPFFSAAHPSVSQSWKMLPALLLLGMLLY